MDFCRLVTPWNQDCRSVSRPDVFDRHQHIDLSNHPFARVVLTERQIAQRCVSPAVDEQMSALVANVQEILVNGHPVHRIDVLPCQVDPGRMVDQSLEDSPTFHDVLEVDTVFIAVAVRFYVTDPPIPRILLFPILRMLHEIPLVIHPPVDLRQISIGDRVLENEISLKIEKVVGQFLFHYPTTPKTRFWLRIFVSYSPKCEPNREETVNIGIGTFCARRGKKEENLQKILDLAKQAADQNCQLVVSPEFSVNGPWVSYDPDATLEDLRENAEPIPGPTTDRLTAEAARLGIALCVGLAEQGWASKPFNTQVVVNADGIVHKQCKLQPIVSEVPFFRGGGDVSNVFTLADRTLGITICADNGNAVLHERFKEQGADIILAPHAGAIKKWEEPGASWVELISWHRKTRLERYVQKAKHLELAFVYVDAVDPRRNFDDLPDWIHYVSGKSACIDKEGRILSQNAGNEESLITASV